MFSIWVRICSMRPLIASASPAPFDEGGVVLGRDHAAGTAEVGHRHAVELAADLLRDHLRAGHRGDVAQHLLAAVAEARGLHRQDVEGAAQLVDDQRRQRLTVDVLGQDHQRLALLRDLLQHRQDVLDRGDLLVGNQDERIVELRLHPLRVGDQVGGEIPAVDLHALGVLGLELEPLGLLDGDDAVLADLLHHLGDEIADLRVRRGDRGDLGDLLLALDRSRLLLDASATTAADPQVKALLEQHGVGAGGDVAHPLVDDGLGQNDGGGRAVTGDVVGLGGRFLEQLRAHIGEVIVELDLLGDGDAVVGDGRRAPLLVEGDVAALGTERGLDGVGEDVDTRLSGTDEPRC